MTSCSTLSGILLLLYLLVSIHYLFQSSLPLEPCIADVGIGEKSCIKPLLYYHQNYINDTNKASTSIFVLELLVPSIDNNNNGNGFNENGEKKSPTGPRIHNWKKISSCFTKPLTGEKKDGSEMTFFELDDFLQSEYQSNLNNDSNDTWIQWMKNEKTKFLSKWSPSTSSSSTRSPPIIRHECKLSFPHDARIRNQNPKTVKPYKGKFILKQVVKQRNDHDMQNHWKETNITIAETLFDLTRIVEKEMRQNRKQKEFVPHYKYHKQALILRVVTDSQHYPLHNPFRGDGYKINYGMLHPRQQLEYKESNNHFGNHYYRPVFYVDNVALRYNSQIELAPPPTTEDEVKPPVTFNIKISFMTPMRHVLQRQLDLGLHVAEQFMRPNELDELRYLISDEYMYRFIITQIIGFIHLIFDYLAFKNEIGFYVGRGKDVTGISISSLYSRCICDLIIFLYLLDGGNTSWFVLLSIGSSVFVELWKLYKFLQPKWHWKKFPYFLSVRDLSSMSSTEQLTIDYDSIARTYLSLILYPLVLGLALYGRQFYIYTSWYSWVISNLANAVYTFGFISLCPQLYINYKLKSVAHLPWRVFLYKIFNTFVDDVFAFLIEMPMKHKIMTLRDDVVFFIFLAQAYMYRVDRHRTNEYGYTYDIDDEKEFDAKSNEELVKPTNNDKSLKID